MNVMVTAEVRFDRTADGAVWTKTTFDQRFWTRYLDVFDEVRVVSRVRAVESVGCGSRRVDGDGVAVVPIPYYHGPWQYLRRRRDVAAALRAATTSADAILFRIPSVLASVVLPVLRLQRRPYAVEVLGDPYEIFAPNAVKHPLRPFLRMWLSRELREHCRDAIGAAYVTREVLQRTYPTAPGAVSTHYSSLDIDQAAFVPEPRAAARWTSAACALVSVGSLQQMYKGADVLLKAMSILARRGVDVTLVWVGGGACRTQLEQAAGAQHVACRVRFAGELPAGEAVRTELDRADLFVMPSRAEGLPRALIEAMARGLPCIGSKVGGIPELLAPEDMVPPDDPPALASAIQRAISAPGRMAEMSRRNLATAREYRSDVLQLRRVALYRHLRDASARWRGLSGVTASGVTI